MRKILIPIIIILFNLFLFLGNRNYKNENYESAMNDFSKAVSMGIDEEGLAHYNLGNSYYKLERYQEAIDAYEEGLEGIEKSGKDKYKEQILFNLGDAYFRLGQTILSTDKEKTIEYWHKAIDIFEEALKIDPNDTEAKENIEYIKKLLEDVEKEPEPQPSITPTPTPTSNVDPKDIEDREKKNRDDKNKYYEDDNPNDDYDDPNW